MGGELVGGHAVFEPGRELCCAQRAPAAAAITFAKERSPELVMLCQAFWLLPLALRKSAAYAPAPNVREARCDKKKKDPASGCGAGDQRRGAEGRRDRGARR